MRVSILILAIILNFSNGFAQIYTVGNDDGFSFGSYAQADNPYFSIYTVGNDEGFSFSSVGAVGGEVPLPIKLLSFTATCSNQSQYIGIKWSTASETNNDYFTLERTTNAINWKIIGTVAGAGNSATTLNYTFTDTEPYNGISYYRLKQTDFDRRFEYSKIVSVRCLKDLPGGINVYPNPFSTELIIEAQGSNEKLNFEILNILGEVIYKGNFVGRIIVQTSHLTQGLYLIKLENSKTFKFEKIIKK